MHFSILGTFIPQKTQKYPETGNRLLGQHIQLICANIRYHIKQFKHQLEDKITQDFSEHHQS